jgi:hypothetical protein
MVAPKDLTLQTRPIFHKRDETIRGHVFVSGVGIAQGAWPSVEVNYELKLIIK